MGDQGQDKKRPALPDDRRSTAGITAACRELLDVIPDPIFLLEPGGAILHANAAASALFGSDKGRLPRHAREIVPPDDTEPPPDSALLEHLARAATGQDRLFPCRLLRAGGEPFEGEVTLRRFGPSEQPRILCHVRDVTLVRRTQRRLRLTQAAVDTAREAMLWIDRDGCIRHANPAAAALLGYPLADLLASSVFDIGLAVTPQHWRRAWSRLCSENSLRLEATCVTREGRRVPVEAASTRLVFEGHELAFVALRDLTDRRRAEEAALEARKAEAIRHLAGGVAHSLNNQLFVVLGYSELLEGELRQLGREDLAARAREIRGAGQAAARLARQLLALGHRRKPNLQSVDVGELLSEMLSAIRSTVGPGIHVRLQIEPGMRAASVDPLQLQEALLHLAQNARDAIADEGEIFIRLGPYSGEAGDKPPGDWISITVRDTGEGMTRDVVARAFDPFFTTRERATHDGLGLSLVQSIIAQSGGHIRIDSAPGEGTRVEMLLPAAGPVAKDPPLP